ncbi:tetratricopeptide repeat protein [Lentzea sp. NPDC055074]
MAGEQVPGHVGLRVLGPLEVDVGGSLLDPGGPRLRAMLALLAAHAGRPVSVTAFVRELWGPVPPPDAERTVRTYVSRLRRSVGDLAGLIRTCAPGYVLLEPEIVDAVRFQRLAREGRAALTDGVVPAARERLTAALALWRGTAYGEFDEIAALEAERTRLAGVRLDVVQDRVDADLAAGAGGELVTELAGLTAEHPGHERLWGQLMTALYRAGRQTDALEAFRRARYRLVEHAGVEPSPALTDIQEGILAHDPRLQAPSRRSGTPSGPRPAQLPPVVPGFTGRHTELAALDAVAEQGTNVVIALCGTAGVGKTALAVRWAHQVAARFPDGQLYVDLRGFDPAGELLPEDALHGFLTALGVSADRVPVSPQAQGALYRSLSAGKRILVVLDNARDASHVRPLLPSSPGSTVVITSRDDLVGLVAREGAARVGLDVLDPGEAVELLGLLIRDLAATRPELEDLASRCARLPLALRIAAELVTRRGRVGLEDLADERRRLDLLEAGADADTAVRSVFSWSERYLPTGAKRLFWLLGLHPGRDIDTGAASALAEVDVREGRVLLHVLHRAHLVERASEGRWAMHDLLRVFARERAEAQLVELHRQAALRNLYEHYLTGALDAMDVVYPETKRWRRGESGRDGASMTPVAAKTWLDTERLTLVAITRAAEGDLAGYAVRLARAIDEHLTVGYHNADAFSVHRHALSAAETLGDLTGKARALLDLGRSHTRSGSYREADERYRQALRLFRRLGDVAGEVRTLHVLGNNESRSRRYHDALATYGLALTLSRQANDRGQEAAELASIGQVQRSLGRHEEALTCYRKAAAIYAETGRRVGQGRILNDLGGALQTCGHLKEAHDHHRQALQILQDIGDRAGESVARTELGRILSRWDRHTEALEHHRTAITVFREIDDPVGETEVLVNLGTTYERMGRHRKAADLHRQAEALAGKLGDRLLECLALNGRGRALGAIGRLDEALLCHEQALAHAKAIEDREQEARSLDDLATARARTGDTAEAHRLWSAALPIYEALCMPEATEVRRRLAGWT